MVTVFGIILVVVSLGLITIGILGDFIVDSNAAAYFVGGLYGISLALLLAGSLWWLVATIIIGVCLLCVLPDDDEVLVFVGCLLFTSLLIIVLMVKNYNEVGTTVINQATETIEVEEPQYDLSEAYIIVGDKVFKATEVECATVTVDGDMVGQKTLCTNIATQTITIYNTPFEVVSGEVLLARVLNEKMGE